jgi:succinate dehydrogenase hydrophobic anchor subunit
LSELSTLDGAADGIKYSIFSVMGYQWSDEHTDDTAASFAGGHESAPFLAVSVEGVIGAIVGVFVVGIVCAAAGHCVYRNVNLKAVRAKFANSAAINYIMCLCLLALLHMVGEWNHNYRDPLATSARS